MSEYDVCDNGIKVLEADINARKRVVKVDITFDLTGLTGKERHECLISQLDSAFRRLKEEG